MDGKLAYSDYTENLIEISLVYASMVAKHPELTETDSSNWKQQFVEWANEFEEKHPDPEYWEENDYLDCIDDFAREKISEYAMAGRQEEK